MRDGLAYSFLLFALWPEGSGTTTATNYFSVSHLLRASSLFVLAFLTNKHVVK